MRKGRSSKYGNENTASQAVGSTLNQVGADKEGGTLCRRKQHRKPLLLQSRLRDLTSYDELELDTLGEKKTALFVIISDTDATFNFIVSIMYSQLFNLLCDKADDVYNGRLPIHVRCLLDEFANIGQIPQFEKLIATIRSREISASIILQSKVTAKGSV